MTHEKRPRFFVFLQIPGEEADDPHRRLSPEEELTKRFKDVMRRIFWDRLTQSLLPPPAHPSPPAGGITPPETGRSSSPHPRAKIKQNARQELSEGSKIQARCQSERGSFCAATITKVRRRDDLDDVGSGGEGRGEGGGGEGGEVVSVDVRYDQDGIVERGVPVSRVRRSDDAPDFGPLLSLLGEVCPQVRREEMEREGARDV